MLESPLLRVLKHHSNLFLLHSGLYVQLKPSNHIQIQVRPQNWMKSMVKIYNLPSGNLTTLWNITMLNGNIHYKWPFSSSLFWHNRMVNLAPCSLGLMDTLTISIAKTLTSPEGKSHSKSHKTTISSDFPMVFPLNHHFPMVFLWFSHSPMAFPPKTKRQNLPPPITAPKICRQKSSAPGQGAISPSPVASARLWVWPEPWMGKQIYIYILHIHTINVSTLTLYIHYIYIHISGWWFQPLWKILVSWDD